MEKKRKAPSRTSTRLGRASKRRQSTPREPTPEPVPEPTPPPVVEKTPPPPPPPPLPISIEAGKPLPTVEKPQPDDLSIEEYQDVYESGVLVESLIRSRDKWINGGLFEKYWTKPHKRKGVLQEDPKNPSKDTMSKVGPVTITLEPHIFEATMYVVKDPKLRQQHKEAQQKHKQMVQQQKQQLKQQQQQQQQQQQYQLQQQRQLQRQQQQQQQQQQRYQQQHFQPAQARPVIQYSQPNSYVPLPGPPVAAAHSPAPDARHASGSPAPISAQPQPQLQRPPSNEPERRASDGPRLAAAPSTALGGTTPSPAPSYPPRPPPGPAAVGKTTVPPAAGTPPNTATVRPPPNPPPAPQAAGASPAGTPPTGARPTSRPPARPAANAAPGQPAPAKAGPAATASGSGKLNTAAPAPAAKPATNDPVIALLAQRASGDPELRDLMKRVAVGQAKQEELNHFQSIINQLNAEYKRGGGQQGPSADRLLVDGRTVKYFAVEVCAILDFVLASNLNQKAADLKPPPRSDALVVLLVKAALEDERTKAMCRRIATDKPGFTDSTDLKEILDRLHRDSKTTSQHLQHPPQKQQQQQQQQQLRPPQNQQQQQQQHNHHHHPPPPPPQQKLPPAPQPPPQPKQTPAAPQLQPEQKLPPAPQHQHQHQPQPQPQLQQQLPGPPNPPQGQAPHGPVDDNGNIQPQAPKQTIRYKAPTPLPPPPPLKSDVTKVIFDLGTGDRYLFPKYSILEYLPTISGQMQVVASFLITRKGGDPDYGGEPDLEYYQPVTIRLSSQSGRHLENLARVVPPQDEVRQHMNDMMDRLIRAEYVHLALRLPRTVKEEDDDDEREREHGHGRNEEGRRQRAERLDEAKKIEPDASAPAPAPLQLSKPSVLWTTPASAPAKVDHVPHSVNEDDEAEAQYRRLIHSVAAKGPTVQL